MRVIVALTGLFIIVGVFWDSFETVVVPRRASSQFQLAALFRDLTWNLWSAPARHMPPGGRRENYLAYYGPLSQLLLLMLWVLGMIVGFAALQWAIGVLVDGSGAPVTFWTYIYFSGTTFLTLGLGDVAPHVPAARLLSVIEAGTGFGLLALVISYLPILYQTFSRRETNISMLDARGGSPPTALALIKRCSAADGCLNAREFLRDWERWSADLLEGHISYPVLGYFRSQHENQSWVAAMAAVLDVSALAMAAMDNASSWQGRLTFAMARHAVVDLAGVYNTAPHPPPFDRLPPAHLARVLDVLSEAGMLSMPLPEVERRLAALRRLYEPYLQTLADYFLMPLQGWSGSEEGVDNWESTAWGSSASLL